MVWIATGRDKLSGLLEEDQWLFRERITLGADEEVDKVAGGASSMSVLVEIYNVIFFILSVTSNQGNLLTLKTIPVNLI